MLTETLPTKPTEIVVPHQPLNVILADDPLNPLTLVLRPDSDLRAINELPKRRLSVRKLADQMEVEFRDVFRHELEQLRGKLDRFQGSTALIGKLASLAREAGEHESERAFLQEAAAVSGDAYFENRLADSMLRAGETARARVLLEALRGKDDLPGLLKLAAILVRGAELSRARTLVDRAIDLDPSDFGARLFDGGLCLAEGNFRGAIHSLRIASEERPTSSVVFANIGIAYLQLGEIDKACAALRRAVLLDPLNSTALFLWSDAAFHSGRDGDVIEPLRLYLQHEEAEAAAWSRLARACMRTANLDEALKALRHEASIRDSSAVWNNLGVVRSLRNETVRALECFKRAVEKAESPDDWSAHLAARNIGQALLSRGLLDEALQFTTRLIEADVDGTFLCNDTLSDIYAFNLHALRVRERHEDLRTLSIRVLERPDAARPLREWVFSSLVAQLAMFERDYLAAEQVIDRWGAEIEASISPASPRYSMLFNNLAVAYTEVGRIEDAERSIARISRHLHAETYPTATLGLIAIKKGDIERGMRLYREAIALARAPDDKARIRQKLALELGRHWATRNPARARRHFRRATLIKHGERVLSDQAVDELQSLSLLGADE